MSIENPGFNPEQEKEPKILTLEEVQAKIEAFIFRVEEVAGKQYMRTLESREDEKGVYLHEVVVLDREGDDALYSYRRKGEYGKMSTACTVIDVVRFVGRVEDGMAVGGSTIANYDEATGTWLDTDRGIIAKEDN